MACTLTTIRNTNNETIVKFEGAGGTATITLNTLAAPTQALTSGGTPTVNIVKLISAGLLTSGVVLSRGGTPVMACAPENAPVINLTQDGISDSVANTADILVTLTGAQCTGYIILRKLSGWDTKVETVTLGAYDNPNVVGS